MMNDMYGIKYGALSGLGICSCHFVPLHRTLRYLALSGLGIRQLPFHPALRHVKILSPFTAMLRYD